MLDSFFRNKEVIGILHHITRLRVVSPDKARVYSERMSTKVTSMSFLNRFEECGAIGKEGHIRGRIEEDWEGVPISNLVREAIMMEESEMYDAFSEQERKEFLLRIFSHLVFGGASNQWEDHVEEYFRVTKAVYKDLLTVRRNDTGDVEVMSMVAAIKSLGQGGQLFPKESPLNFCYVIVDPLMRHVSLWYFGYKSVW
uniref:Cilia- and flagella-associated protein 300 n=1 Tax=Strombidinopsis acuminata TaxID=141414 RepID=A0A7S3RSF1_9SPIT